MKILHLLSSKNYAGAQNVACQIIHLFDQEIEMAYCSPIGPIKETLGEKGIAYLPISKLSLYEFKKVLKQYKPDLIHAHDIKASIIAAICSGNIPVISHIHVNAVNMSKISFKSILYACFMKKYKHVLVVSQSIVEDYYFRKALLNKCSVLYNVVDENELIEKVNQDALEYDFDCVYLGRFTYQKNPQRLIEIVSKVVKRLPDVKIAFIGSGDLLMEAKELVEERGIGNHVTFTGFLNNPYKLLKASKVMIMSSRTEGTPMVVLEAMLLGVPVVATPVDGIKEIITNEYDGYYYDEDESLVTAICKLLTEEELRKEISKNAYSKGKQMNDLGKYKNCLSDIYLKCIEVKNENCLSDSLE
jgi:glycosyltransferase involved in cell wall biosynthesis